MKGKKYTAYSIVTTLLEEMVLVVVVRWLLPVFGVNIPIWLLVLLMIAWGTYSYISYRLTKKVHDKEILTPAEAMIGRKGMAVTSLKQEGIVRIGSELWKASAIDLSISAYEEIVVVGINGLLLFVTRVEGSK